MFIFAILLLTALNPLCATYDNDIQALSMNTLKNNKMKFTKKKQIPEQCNEHIKAVIIVLQSDRYKDEDFVCLHFEDKDATKTIYNRQRSNESKAYLKLKMDSSLISKPKSDDWYVVKKSESWFIFSDLILDRSVSLPIYRAYKKRNPCDLDMSYDNERHFYLLHDKLFQTYDAFYTCFSLSKNLRESIKGESSTMTKDLIVSYYRMENTKSIEPLLTTNK